MHGALGTLISLLGLVGFVGLGILGGMAGTALRDALFPPPAKNLFAAMLPGSLFILGAWVGAVVPLFIPGVRRYTDQERHGLVLAAIQLPAKFVHSGWGRCRRS
jgi:hypothetical protein